MSSPRNGSSRCPSAKAFVLTGTALAIAGWAGCNSPASRVGSGAATGAAVGATGGLLVGSNSNMGPLAGLAAGSALGAGVGAIVGAIKQSKDNKEQAQMAQERSFMAERAARMKEEAVQKAQLDQELAVAQGFQISDVELDQALRRKEAADSELKGLQQQMADAASRTKALKDAQDKTLQTEAEIASAKEMLARLKGETLTTGDTADKDKVKDASTTPGSDAK